MCRATQARSRSAVAPGVTVFRFVRHAKVPPVAVVANARSCLCARFPAAGDEEHRQCFTGAMDVAAARSVAQPGIAIKQETIRARVSAPGQTFRNERLIRLQLRKGVWRRGIEWTTSAPGHECCLSLQVLSLRLRLNNARKRFAEMGDSRESHYRVSRR
jgi:hypothetical protein